MNDSLDKLAQSIGGAHAAVDEIVDAVTDREGDSSDWRVGTTDERPETSYDERDDGSVVVVETADVSAARYTVRELVQRGFHYDESEETPDGRFVYAFNAS